MTSSDVVDWILSLHGYAALAVVFLGPALEASAFVGFVFPGEVAVLLGGVLAYHGRIPLWAAIVAAVAGAIVGDSIGYWVGREYGHRILATVGARLPFVGHRIDAHLDGAEAYVRRRGASAVFFGRFTAALRVMVPGLAGMSRIPYRRFAFFNVLGGLVWATAFVLLGYFAGAAWERVASIASRAGLGLLALVVLILVGGRVLRVWQRAETAERGPIARARRRWPRQVRWLERRFEPGSSTGFPLSIAVVAGAACVWVFVAITQDVLANEEAVRLDPEVLRFVLDHRTAAWTAVMKAVTTLGSSWVLVPLAVGVGVIVSVRRRSWRPIVAIGAALSGSILLADGFKRWVARPRPPLSVRLVAETTPAFPSSHATKAAAVFAVLAVVLTTRASARMRVVAGAVAALLILVVGASRIYLGVHWFTDVIGGWALGASWASAILIVGLVTGRDATRPRPQHR